MNAQQTLSQNTRISKRLVSLKIFLEKHFANSLEKKAEI